MASRFANADAGGRDRVGVALRWPVESGSHTASKVPARDKGGFVNHQRNVNQPNIGPRLINSTEEKLIKQPTHSIDG